MIHGIYNHRLLTQSSNTSRPQWKHSVDASLHLRPKSGYSLKENLGEPLGIDNIRRVFLVCLFYFFDRKNEEHQCPSYMASYVLPYQLNYAGQWKFAHKRSHEPIFPLCLLAVEICHVLSLDSSCPGTQVSTGQLSSVGGGIKHPTLSRLVYMAWKNEEQKVGCHLPRVPIVDSIAS